MQNKSSAKRVHITCYLKKSLLRYNSHRHTTHLKCIIQWLLISFELRSHYYDFRTLSSSQEEILYALAVTSHSPPESTLALGKHVFTTFSLLDVPILNIVCEKEGEMKKA